MSGSDNAHFPLLDGGLGWWTVLAAALANFVSMGLYRSGGIIYVASVKYFSASRSIAAWIPMVTMMLVFFTAPIATFLSTKFTFHRIIFLGGIIASIGMLINFIAADFEVLFIGWSLLFGVGSSLAFFPAIAIVSQSFKSKRPIANSFVLAGAGIGSSFMPPLLEYLINIYGLNGAFLLMGGFVMQYFIVGMLARSVFLMTRPRVIKPPPKMEAPLMSKSDVNEEKLLFHLDLSFIRNCTYVVNAFANAIQTALFFGLLTILPDFAAEEIGVSRIKGAYLVSATAIADLVTRLPSGFCLLKCKLRKSIFYIIVLVINVLALLILANVTNYYAALVVAAICGSCFAIGVSLYFEIVALSQTPEEFPKAFGCSEMIKAPFMLITATSVGSLKDATGSYSTTFLILATGESLAIALWIFEIAWNMKRKSKNILSNVEIN